MVITNGTSCERAIHPSTLARGLSGQLYVMTQSGGVCGHNPVSYTGRAPALVIPTSISPVVTLVSRRGKRALSLSFELVEMGQKSSWLATLTEPPHLSFHLLVLL